MRHVLHAVFFLLALPALALAAEPAEYLGNIDELWKSRDAAEAKKGLETAFEAGLKEHPANYDLLWRASRFKWWQADGATDKRLKKQLGKESWALGDRAIKANPKGAEGHYYAAIGMGAYSQAVGIMKAIGEGIEGQFNERLDRSIAIDPTIDLGGPWVAKGRYYYELPWPKRDLEKSAELYNKAIKKFPNHLRAYVFLAEVQLADGEEKAAQGTIAKALGGDVAYDPPEGRRMKSEAKRVSAAIEEELK